jgi:hypothetical protein
LSLVSILIDIIILGSAGFSFIGTRATFSCFLIFVPVLLAESLVFVCMFLPWFSATCSYDTFVDILRADIEIIEYIRSEYRVAERDISINTSSLTARILVIILSSSLVLSKVSGLFLYHSIYLSRVLASIAIMLVLFWVILLILSAHLPKISSAELGLRGLLPTKNRGIIFYSKYTFFVAFLPLIREVFCYCRV